MATKRIQSLVVVSDIHAGCQLGLCPPAGALLDNAGRYMPSDFQAKTWAWWQEFWRWVKKATRGEPFAVVHNGDAVDGVHHNSTTQITHNLTMQGNIAYDVLAPIVELCHGRYYHIRGTDAHGGKSGQEEEALARRLGAIPSKKGQYARDALWKYVGGKQEILCNILHTIGTTGSMGFATTALRKEIVRAYVEAGCWRRRPPDVVIRSHRHTADLVANPTWNTRGFSVVTPGWQGKTGFAWRIAGARLSEPQFGGVLVRLSDEGEPYVRQWTKSLDPPDPE